MRNDNFELMKGLAFLALFCGAVFGIACSRSDNSILPVLKEHMRRHPDMQAEDIYKLAHQAAMGNGHLFTDTAGVRLYLLNEFDEVSADSSEPMIETLSPDGAVVRLNLRPYKARGGDTDRLFQAMLSSADRIHQDPELLERWWQEIVAESEFGTIPADKTTLRELFASMKAAGFPPRHHSETYEAAYAPAYRVLLRELVPPVR
ncbi:MAG: hypothetical protein AABY75_08535 [Bacteroidota bacterium]